MEEKIAMMTKKIITANLRYYRVKRKEIDIEVSESVDEFGDMMTVIAFYYKGTKNHAGLGWFYHDAEGNVIPCDRA